MAAHPTSSRGFTPSARSLALRFGWAVALTCLTPSSSTAAEDPEYLRLNLPAVGDRSLRIVSPTVLELKRINTTLPNATAVDSWDFVDANGNLVAPATSEFAVTIAGTPVAVSAVGFKRRPVYAPDRHRDLRIDNNLYLQLAAPVGSGQHVTVANPSGSLWNGDAYAQTADPLRYSPAIHVNQEGYVPTLPKKAMVGYYLGSLGELPIDATTFQLVDAATGIPVFSGSLTPRADVGFLYTPTPYQQVREADFTAFATPGRYRLAVPGLGASFPFVIDDGVTMGFLRAYALGLYHQRCGATNAFPYTRFTHDACHTAAVEVPTAAAEFAFTWATIAARNADALSNPRHTAPRLVDAGTQRYPFVNSGPLDLAGGHHDAGDYSRYTINSAALVHTLMFTVDAMPGAGDLDNLGVPESGDGIGDLLQEAKREADFLAAMQDADGGFYFLVYPKTRAYEYDVLPDAGDSQVVWPKNTAATAAAVAALAQCASSPRFQAAFPTAAAAYLQKAELGWEFLMDAIDTHGWDGAYQKLSFYGDSFLHDDELAWAACELFLATGDAQYHTALRDWFPDPSDPDTFRWGWWRLAESWGRAVRSYAFAARTNRIPLGQLDAAYLALCEAQLIAAGDDALTWSNQNAYATSFPEETKRFRTAGWYFSLDQAADLAVAHQLDPKPGYVEALLGNMNYEGGTNPVNVSYVTGLGWKRQRELVSQYAQNDRRVLPPDGIPIGNIQAGFSYLYLYGTELTNLVFPSEAAEVAPYEFYDRWADSYNLTTEYIALNQARSILALAALAPQSTAAAQAWSHATASIDAPAGTAPLGTPLELALEAGALDLTHARVVWEARDQEPAFGTTYSIAPRNNGTQWVEAEIQWPDGRRVFSTNSFWANSPVVNWVDGAVPQGATTLTEGGDAWTWIDSNPAPQFASRAHRSNLAAGLHYHAFADADATMFVGPHDVLFAWVYLDPVNPPTELMLTWNDGSDEHRAFWGANEIHWGTFNSAGRRPMGPLPAAGEWLRLEVPASLVNLEGSTVRGMGFVLFGGRVTYDTAGVLTAAAPSIATPPTSQSVAFNTGVTLSVTASGLPTPTYQWRKNGANIEGATAATYTIGAAAMTDAGNYDVVVTNALGAVTSSSAVLTVLKAHQSIDFASLANKSFGDIPFALTATASSTLPVTFSIVSGPATIAANVLTITGAGTVIVRASQSGNANYFAAPTVDREFSISTPFAEYLAEFNIDPGIPGQALANPSGDGLPNLIKYALGGDPTETEPDLHPTAFAVGTNSAPILAYRFVFNPEAAQNLTLDVESSTDLVSWNKVVDGQNDVAVTTIVLNSLAHERTVTIPCVGVSVFARLRVSSIGDDAESACEPLGIFRRSAAASSDTHIVPVFGRAPVWRGRVSSVAGLILSVSGLPNWTVGQFAPASETYYIRLLEGPMAGHYFTILGNTVTTLQVDAAGLDLSGIDVGTQVEVAPFWTLGTLFPASAANVSFAPSSSAVARQTELLFYDPQGSGINRSPAETYYFLNGAWRKVGSSVAISQNGKVLLPDTYFLQRNKSLATNVVESGRVLRGPLATILEVRPDAQHDNFVAISFPVAVSLRSTGLIASGAFRSSTSAVLRTDQLLAFDPLQTGINRSPSATYYYLNGGWRRVGAPVAQDFSDSITLPAGAGFIIRKAADAAATFWNFESNP